MNNTHLKCISFFSGENSNILIITNERKYSNSSKSICIPDPKTVDFISLSEEFGLSLLSDYNKKKLYDLIILDQVCESPLLCKKLASLWKTRDEMFTALSARIHSQGSMVIFTQNVVYLHQLSLLRHALTNLFKRTAAPGTFLRQFTRELKSVGFLKFDYFYVYPDKETLTNLISTERHAFQQALSLKYGLPLDVTRQPRYWLRWILTNSQLDRWLFRCQMIWIRK